MDISPVVGCTTVYVSLSTRQKSCSSEQSVLHHSEQSFLVVSTLTGLCWRSHQLPSSARQRICLRWISEEESNKHHNTGVVEHQPLTFKYCRGYQLNCRHELQLLYSSTTTISAYIRYSNVHVACCHGNSHITEHDEHSYCISGDILHWSGESCLYTGWLQLPVQTKQTIISSSQPFLLPAYRLEPLRHSFFLSTTKPWNDLPGL